MAFRSPLMRVADAFGFQHPKTVYYRRPKIISPTPPPLMTPGTRAGVTILLLLFIGLMSAVAFLALVLTGYSLFEAIAG